MQPGSKVLYLGAASGTTVSHVADLVGPVSGYINLTHLSVDCISTFATQLKLIFILLNRKEQFMQSNSQRDQAET